MKKIQASVFILLMICIAATISILIREKQQPSLSGTFSPLFQQLGKPIKSIDRAISKVMPIDEIDEQILGETIRVQFEKEIPEETDVETINYLNTLIQNLSSNSKKILSILFILKREASMPMHFPGELSSLQKDFLSAYQVKLN